jgi:hypothetical protein
MQQEPGNLSIRNSPNKIAGTLATATLHGNLAVAPNDAAKLGA